MEERKSKIQDYSFRCVQVIYQVREFIEEDLQTLW